MKNKINKSFLMHKIIICLAAVMIFSAGCTASRSFPNNTVQVVVSMNQNITLEGKIVDVKKLPARLKSLGATPETTIRILIQKNTTKELMTQISSALATEGFRRIFFTMPKQIEVISPDSPKE